MPTLTMFFSAQDDKNATCIMERFGLNNKAHAVSVAVKITRQMIDVVLGGGTLYVRKDGILHKIIITGLNDTRYRRFKIWLRTRIVAPRTHAFCSY